MNRLVPVTLPVWLTVVATLGCSAGNSGQKSSSPDAMLGFGSASTRCDNFDRELPLLGWDPAERGKLATLTGRSIVIVGYKRDGCTVDLEILAGCESRHAQYQYTSYEERRRVMVENNDQLRAAIPLGTKSLRASFEGQNMVRADYHLSGVERLPVGVDLRRADLAGSCSRATHFVTAIYRGAFAIATGERLALSADAVLAAVSTDRRVQLLTVAGDDAACRATNAKLTTGCDVPLRLELSPIEGEATLDGPLPPARTDRPWSKPPPRLVVPAGSRCPEHMVAFDGGTFTMGRDDGPPMESPAHPVEVPPFCLDETEVTVRDYHVCEVAGICPQVSTRDQHPRCNGAKLDEALHPRNCVTIEHAEAYCEWLGKRLPTEAEWEFAAKGGKANRTYPTGMQPPQPSQACIGKDYGAGTTCRVGSKPREPSGLYDMCGNVSEIVSGGYVAYPGSREKSWKDSFWAEVQRGGNYHSDHPNELRTTAREQTPSEVGHGFRCAL